MSLSAQNLHMVRFCNTKLLACVHYFAIASHVHESAKDLADSKKTNLDAQQLYLHFVAQHIVKLHFQVSLHVWRVAGAVHVAHWQEWDRCEAAQVCVCEPTLHASTDVQCGMQAAANCTLAIHDDLI